MAEKAEKVKKTRWPYKKKPWKLANEARVHIAYDMILRWFRAYQIIEELREKWWISKKVAKEDIAAARQKIREYEIQTLSQAKEEHLQKLTNLYEKAAMNWNYKTAKDILKDIASIFWLEAPKNLNVDHWVKPEVKSILDEIIMGWQWENDLSVGSKEK